MDRDKEYRDACNQWLADCMLIYHNQVEKIRKKRLAAATEALTLCIKKQKKCVNETIKETIDFDTSYANKPSSVQMNVPKKVLEDLSFHSYIRMSATQLENLVSLTGPEMQKNNCFKKSIGVAQGLLLTLKFLAAGDSIYTVSCQYSIDCETIENIISTACKAIWNQLVLNVMPSDLSKNRWLKMAQEFEEKWDFPHCIGAIDAVHIVMQPSSNESPSKQKSNERNSIVLLAICDANFIFTFVDMGTYGCNGEIFRASQIGCAFENNDMNLPKPSPLNENDTENFPYVLVGDEAFPLKTYLLRPYPQKDCIEVSRLNFNCRLIRAQKTIETCLGILSSRWQIFSKTINMDVDKTMKIVQACVCLHNWLRLSDLSGNSCVRYMTTELVDQKVGDVFVAGSCRKSSERSGAFKDISCVGSNVGSRKAIQIRDSYLHYFNSNETLTRG
ncbi:protein ANTAGONIST OF LIKE HETEROCHROMATIN PROTEIN 1-like [Copidosoma floridanum]|uniref:protein ANTAGONIST OF LIKE HETEROCHROMATIN PROTEIN 1-like n=1 Tax=Copidosoma floridanum TaxID=29053 RepID=UPI0006C9CE42|nr:protein ANTAGONIST OF LIKE HETEROCHROMATIN PROTEIN 1-like [Copidosoma floridanum]